MIDIFMSVMVFLFLAVGTLLFSRSIRPEVRALVWLGLIEYMGCSAGQQLWTWFVIEGGDTVMYTERGAELAKYMDQSFWFTAPEVLRLLFQQPSGVDNIGGVVGAGSNTGSMFAASAFLIYFMGGSIIAAQFLTAGLSFFAALLFFKAFEETEPTLNPRWVFLATVLFPSVAFWTSAILKEAFCFMGIGLVLGAWRCAYSKRWIRFVLMLPLGVTLLALFRAPTMPPLALGIALYFVYTRLRKTRGGDVIILGPVYLAMGFIIVAGGMVLLTQLDPTLGLDRIGETMGRRQRAWTAAQGGSNIDSEVDMAPATPLEQLSHVPIALVNALFRPQLFDVHNIATLISAIEMTIVSYLLIRTLLRTGWRGIMTEIERSPLLLMCSIVGFVGCTFVGLVTYNLGSLARYRVPFLPFYAMFIVYLYKPRKLPQLVVSEAAPPPLSPLSRLPVRRGTRA